MAAIPANDDQNNNPMFPEGEAGGLLPSVNRGLLNWFLVDQTARNGAPDDPYTSIVDFNEIYREAKDRVSTTLSDLLSSPISQMNEEFTTLNYRRVPVILPDYG
ncbi:MAG: hypothetical protein R2769_03270 [Saprospiraceae bacterium]